MSLAPVCRCGTASTFKTSRAGKDYWSCGKCEFFQWADAVRSVNTVAGPKCKCGEPTRQLPVTKMGKNHGRKFWTCASRRCKFFQWVDPNEVQVTPPASPSKKRKASDTTSDASPSPQKRTRDDVRTLSQGSSSSSASAGSFASAVCCSKCSSSNCTRKVSQSKANPGREYWKCEDCGAFVGWTEATLLEPASETTSNTSPSPQKLAREVRTLSQDSSSSSASVSASASSAASASALATAVCCSKCSSTNCTRKVSQSQANPGREYWKCEDCGAFVCWTEATLLEPVTPDLKGYADFVVDHETKQSLQSVLDTVSLPRDSQRPYDKLEVATAWRIKHPKCAANYEAYKQQIKDEVNAGNELLPSVEALTDDTVDRFDNIELDDSVNEALLLHGTDPDHMQSVLFEGLDPNLSRKGRFGRGIYFAESAVKSNDYTSLDRDWQGSKDSDIGRLHKSLYKAILMNKHPGDVRYMLVCRVVLGNPVKTVDGRRSVEDGEALFSGDEHSCIAKPGRHSVLAEPKNEPREFVVFSPHAMVCEYLVAYRRVRTLCDCGEPLVQRTVVKDNNNHGRYIYFCPKGSKDNDNGCGFMRMLPLCHCGRSATAFQKKGSSSGKVYFQCCYRRKRCDFFLSKGDNSASTTVLSGE
jgi:hypothetical protein